MENSNLKPATLFVVGDSTGCTYSPNTDATYYYKRVGFGTRLNDYFCEKLTVNNLALSGRSSKSFMKEKNYQKFLDGISQGDYLIIAFGHNDEKTEDVSRYANPTGGLDDVTSFKYSLYENYIKIAQNAGATAILCTPIVRRSTNGIWEDIKVHITPNGDYAKCVRELGAELGITVIDNTANTRKFYDELTPSGSVYLHAWTANDPSTVDNTHLSNYGASAIAYLMAKAIKESGNSLGDYVLENISLPKKEDTLIVNPNYKEKELNKVLTKSLLWKTTEPWYGSVFGEIDGQEKINKFPEDTEPTINPVTGNTYYNISENADGSVNIRSGEADPKTNTSIVNAGKIATITDGIAMYFRPVDSAVNFAISGTIKINAVDNHSSQAAFGAIVADDVDIDKCEVRYINHIAASPIKMGKFTDMTKTVPAANMGYVRLKGSNVSSNAGNTDYLPKSGDTVNVKITKVGNKYTVEFNEFVSEYNVDFKGNIYVGFYTARCADITVSNIVFNNEVTE